VNAESVASTKIYNICHVMILISDACTLNVLCYQWDVAFALNKVSNYTLRVMLQIVIPLTDDPRGVIYNRKIFIVQATDFLKKRSYDRFL
jgi:hypothetical protein